MTEAVLGNAHQVQAHALNDGSQRVVAGAVENLVNLFGAVEDEGQGDDIQSLVEVGIDQVGVGGQIDRAIADSLDALGLAAVGQLVHRVDFNGKVAGGALVDVVSENIRHLGPAGRLGRGAAEGQGHVITLDEIAVGIADSRQSEDHAQSKKHCE